MNQTSLQPPPTIFKFTGPVPPQVEVFSNGRELRITVAPPVGRQRWPLIWQFGIVALLMWVFAVAALIVLPPHMFPMGIMFVIGAVIFSLGPLAGLGLMLSAPTVFSIRDNSMFRLQAPNNRKELSWPLSQPEMLGFIGGRLLYNPARRRGCIQLLTGYPPETCLWVLTEFQA